MQRPLCMVSFVVCSLAAFASPPAAKKEKPPIVRITSRLYRIGTVLVDTAAHTVTVQGSINMSAGPVEYAAVTPRGKTYESLLRLNVQPLYLQVALLLAGLKPHNVLQYQGQHKTPQGAPLTLTVHWHDYLGAPRTARVEDFLLLEPGSRPMPHHNWVFTGSRILPQGFEADLCGSLIAVYHDPAALIDNPLPAGSSNGWVVNPHTTPRQFTPITLVIHAAQASTGK